MKTAYGAFFGMSILFAVGLAQADVAAVHYHKALALKNQKKTDLAILELKKALANREDYAAAHLSLGILYRQQKEYSKAIFHLEKAADLEPKSAEAHLSLGKAYHYVGRKEEALVSLEKALKLDPNDLHIRYTLGVMFLGKDPTKAIEYLHAVVKAKPTEADFNHQLGLAYRKATNQLTGPKNKDKRTEFLKEAEKYLLKAAAVKEDAGLEFDLGVLFRRTERASLAIEHYENAVRLDPRMAAAFWDLGILYSQAKEYGNAIRCYENYEKLTGGKDNIAKKRLEELREKTK
ncbi:MAG: tetratricopeptide repeat protein [Pseudomonadota bacterium]